ncbi:GntR family transcriptional regulator [Labrenzia sp. PHM005]|uniref:GntR family transcriptional regulator n=1 Tax=Labrenzia sp. PHM005 TaxID=2590016 RepID=UPI0011408E64|nr:GntR family transcriptional regulator [Labrenzia sp. PHM005]QDG75836.1 GntR family transcriptional regulator [Labrenzia sp. PHM005]
MLARVKETRVDNAYEKLKADILLGELPPGFQAPEPEIAARLQMSRTPVREALIRLETEGLVVLIPRRGARVLSMNVQDLVEVMEILGALEALAAATIAHQGLSADVCAEMESVLDAGSAALADGDLLAWAEYDARFHRLLGKWSNRRLEREIGLHLDQLHRVARVLVRMNGAPVEQPEDHFSLIRSMKSGNAAEAAAIAQSHRETALSNMKALFESSGVTHL